MRTLLRSCIVVKIADPPELFLPNILALDQSGLVPEVLEEKTLWRLIRDFAKLHQHAPDFKTLQLQLQASSDLTALDYLELVIRESPKTRGDFALYLERKIEERRSSSLLEALRVARAIATTGLEVEGERGKKQQLRGVDTALDRLRSETRNLERAPTGLRISGEVTGTDAAADLRSEYERAKISPVIGNLCGIMQIDVGLRGSKNQELWVHAASTGQLKSTFAANWAYNLAVIYRRSSLYFSLEMTYAQIRRQLAAMHSFHYKFRSVRHQLGLQADEDTDAGLDYEKIRYGQLSPTEEDFYLNYVLPDLQDDSQKYGKIHVEVADPNKTRFTSENLRDVAERRYEEDPYHQVIVDHAGLVGTNGYHRSETEKQTEIYQGLHRLSRGFRQGQGIAVIALAQITRDGFKTSQRKKEAGRLPRYTTADLAWASEAERSADIITTTYVDDGLRARSRVLFDCLKNRDGGPLDPFLARVYWPSRRLLCCDDPITTVEAPTKSRRSASGPELLDALGAATTPNPAELPN